MLKTFRYFILTGLFVLQAAAQDPEPGTNSVGELLASQKEFLNLPEKQRADFAVRFRAALGYYQQKRIFECLEAIHQAEKIFEESADLLNLKGSCFVEMRSFDKALVALRKAKEINPQNTSIRFNIAEILFVTKQWQESLTLFEEILNEIDPEKMKSLARLVEFKIMLCQVKLGREEEVIILAGKYDYLDDTPFYYFANAALAFGEGDVKQAALWLGQAERIFRDPSMIAPWEDTLIEFGYLKSFYGDDQFALEGAANTSGSAE